MTWTCSRATIVGVLASFAIAESASAQFAVEVISYASGTTPATVEFTMPAAAIGSPERFTGEGEFPGVVSPFNPPFLANEIVSVGEGGQLTLRLSNYAVPQVGVPEIGVFANVGFIETDFPNGQAGSPAGAFGIDSAIVDVSENGSDWVSLGSTTFDVPTNGYTDLPNPFSGVAGSALSDFQQPFVGGLSNFDGLRYADAGEPDMLDLLAGSGGGKWIDISASGLAQVGFIRFSVLDDMTAAGLNFELDAVSISNAAMGGVTVPEPAAIVLAGLAIAPLLRRRSRSLLSP
jgi:hypothetical protein